jgi:hypothetical protein
MEIRRKCEYLVHYDKMFVEGDFEIIIMDYFEKGRSIWAKEID